MHSAVFWLQGKQLLAKTLTVERVLKKLNKEQVVRKEKKSPERGKNHPSNPHPSQKKSPEKEKKGEKIPPPTLPPPPPPHPPKKSQQKKKKRGGGGFTRKKKKGKKKWFVVTERRLSRTKMYLHFKHCVDFYQ